MTNKRIFQIADYPYSGQSYGNYTGQYPSQAAKKIFNFLANKSGFTHANSKNVIVFSIIEKANLKKYNYIGTRMKLVNPTKITYPGGKQVEHKYKTLVTKHKQTYKNLTIKGGAIPIITKHNSIHPSHEKLQNIQNSVYKLSQYDGNVDVPVKTINRKAAN